MSKSRTFLRLAVVAVGAAAGAALAFEARRRLRAHQIEGRAARDTYTAAYPAQRYWLNLAGCLTHIYESGSRDSTRPPLLLIHGGVVEGASWLETVTALATDRLVIAPDLPAHGASGYLPPAQLLNWLEAVVDYFDLDQFDLCGHSLGGSLALRYAVRHVRHAHRLRRLIVCAPTGTGQFFPRLWPEPWNTGLLNLWPLHDSLIEKVWGEPALITPTQREQFGLMFRDFFYSARWWWYLTGGWLWLLDLPLTLPETILTPALFLWGERDRVVPFSQTRTQPHIQAMPNAQLQFLTNLGHLPQVEGPAIFNAAVRGFLD
jgi:pyruvate dehydrogenase E2 component (dihydrolipoamide acetyltransferase)